MRVLERQYIPVLPHPAYLLSAIVVTLSGVWLRWKAHEFRMNAEEAMKDGKLTHEQVERRITLIKNGSRALTVVGIVMLLACALRSEFL